MAQFREVLISWRDNPDDCFLVTVGVDGAWNSLDEEDDDVFFWFASEREYQECLVNGEEEFTMKDYDDA